MKYFQHIRDSVETQLDDYEYIVVLIRDPETGKESRCVIHDIGMDTELDRPCLLGETTPIDV